MPYLNQTDTGWVRLHDTGVFTALVDTDFIATDITIPQDGVLRITYFQGTIAGVLKISGMTTALQLLNGGTAVPISTPYAASLEVTKGDVINFEQGTGAPTAARLIASLVLGGQL